MMLAMFHAATLLNHGKQSVKTPRAPRVPIFWGFGYPTLRRLGSRFVMLWIHYKELTLKSYLAKVFCLFTSKQPTPAQP